MLSLTLVKMLASQQYITVSKYVESWYKIQQDGYNKMCVIPKEG